MSLEFAREVLKVVVAQISQGFGFQVIEATALETLAEVLENYLEEVAYNAKLNAEDACRIESNFEDVIMALGEMGCSSEDLRLFHGKAEEVQFARVLPAFPMEGKSVAPGILRDPPPPRPSHIPEWLPPFPDTHTYQHTPILAQPDLDPKKTREGANTSVVNYDQVRDLPPSVGEASTMFQPRQEVIPDAMDVDEEPVQSIKTDIVPMRQDDRILQNLMRASHVASAESALPNSPNSPKTPNSEKSRAEQILALSHSTPNAIDTLDADGPVPVRLYSSRPPT